MTPTVVRRIPAAISAGTSSQPEMRAIPFDHAFRYVLTGTPGNVINSVVTVSIEAAFIAIAIGYGVVPKVQPVFFGGAAGSEPDLRSVTLGSLFESLGNQLQGNIDADAVFKNGFRLNPAIADVVLQNDGRVPLRDDLFQRMFQAVGSPSELIQFKYAIFDEGSGREFQSEPILNIAGLGSANGERPFRYFAEPIEFRPRSTIRMEVTEISDFEGELHVALQGYKVLGGSGTPTGTSQRRMAARRR